MKLKNKKTGEIVSLQGELTYDDKVRLLTHYNSLAELNKEWEDYEEPKSGIEGIRLNDMISGRHIVEIDFTKVEEAEKAVEKLKALKRLKDKGFRFQTIEFECSNLCGNGFEIHFWATMPPQYYNEKEKDKDLDLLFGSEE